MSRPLEFSRQGQKRTAADHPAAPGGSRIGPAAAAVSDLLPGEQPTTSTSELDAWAVELAGLERRLRRLEERLSAPAPGLPALPVPMLAARPADWPAVCTGEWELLAVALVTMGDEAGVQVQLHVAADAGTTGSARVLVDGRAAGEEVAIAGAAPVTHTVAVVDGSVIAVQARRSSGAGRVRVAAVLHTRQWPGHAVTP